MNGMMVNRPIEQSGVHFLWYRFTFGLAYGTVLRGARGDHLFYSPWLTVKFSILSQLPTWTDFLLDHLVWFTYCCESLILHYTSHFPPNALTHHISSIIFCCILLLLLLWPLQHRLVFPSHFASSLWPIYLYCPAIPPFYFALASRPIILLTSLLSSSAQMR